MEEKEKLVKEFERFVNEVYHNDSNQKMLEKVLELLKEEPEKQ